MPRLPELYALAFGCFLLVERSGEIRQAWLPAPDVLQAQGLLVPVLPDFVDLRPVPVYAVTAGTRHRLPKIKACLDYWTEWFAR